MATVLGFAFAVPGVAWLMLQRWLDRGNGTGRAPQLLEVEPVTEASRPI